MKRAKSSMQKHLRFLARPIGTGSDRFPKLILDQGEWFYGRANVGEYEVAKMWTKAQRPRAKDCFFNAQQFCLDLRDDRYRYMEGYVLMDGGMPIQHAWVVMEDGKVVDFTLEAMERKAKREKIACDTSNALYRGIEVPRQFVRAQILETGYSMSFAEVYFNSLEA